MDEWNPSHLREAPSGPPGPRSVLGAFGYMLVVAGVLACVAGLAQLFVARPAVDIHVDCQLVLETAPDTLALVLAEPRGTPDCLPYWRAKLRAAGFTPAADSTPAEVAP